jgi:hypothetical protein
MGHYSRFDLGPALPVFRGNLGEACPRVSKKSDIVAKILRPLMRFTRGDVRDTISFHPKSTTNLFRRAESRRSNGKSKNPLSPDFWD